MCTPVSGTLTACFSGRRAQCSQGGGSRNSPDPGLAFFIPFGDGSWSFFYRVAARGILYFLREWEEADSIRRGPKWNPKRSGSNVPNGDIPEGDGMYATVSGGASFRQSPPGLPGEGWNKLQHALRVVTRYSGRIPDRSRSRFRPRRRLELEEKGRQQSSPGAADRRA